MPPELWSHRKHEGILGINNNHYSKAMRKKEVGQNSIANSTIKFARAVIQLLTAFLLCHNNVFEWALRVRTTDSSFLPTQTYRQVCLHVVQAGKRQMTSWKLMTRILRKQLETEANIANRKLVQESSMKI